MLKVKVVLFCLSQTKAVKGLKVYDLLRKGKYRQTVYTKPHIWQIISFLLSTIEFSVKSFRYNTGQFVLLLRHPKSKEAENR